MKEDTQAHALKEVTPSSPFFGLRPPREDGGLRDEVTVGPPMSPALRMAISRRYDDFHGRRETVREREMRLKRGDPALGLVLRARKPTAYAKTVVAEAQKLYDELESGFRPTPPARLRHEIDQFLDVLNASVANPQDADALLMRKSALAIALEGTPVLVWTQNMLRRAQRRFVFFPSVAALIALFEAAIDAVRTQMDDLRHVASQEEREGHRSPTPQRSNAPP